MSETIVRIAARGEGVTVSGRHAALAAPGDILLPDGDVTAGPHRVSPPCRHFPRCGGCQLQHVDDGSYADYLKDRIGHALAAHGLIVPELRVPHLSPPRTRRRATLQAERRGKTVVLGFNEAASHSVVSLAECHILQPALFALMAPLRELLVTIMPHRGRARLAMTMADQGVDLTIAGFAIEGVPAIEAVTAFGVRHRLARVSVDEGYGATPRYQPDDVTVTFGGVAVSLPHDAFLQATADGEAALVAAVRTAVGDAAAIADLFCGLGTFALALGGKVHAVDGARDAVAALAATGRVTTAHRDLFRSPLAAAELARFDAVVLDPPRAGAKDQTAALATSRVPRIAAVSCNPATFARDAAALVAGGYRLDWIQPVGQFRWSTHVELVGAFSR